MKTIARLIGFYAALLSPMLLFLMLANLPHMSAPNTAAWNAWCRVATRSHEWMDATGIHWHEYGASQVQNFTSGVIVCDDGTAISATDGHRLP